MQSDRALRLWQGSHARLTWVSFAAIVAITSVPAAAQVTIEGGQQREIAPNHYEWTITNHGTKVITSFQIPHYLGNIFTCPEGWEFTITNKVRLGMKHEPGLITAKAVAPQAGIQPSRSATFRLRAFYRNTAPAKRDATITFADGSTEVVAGVEIPWRASWLHRHTLLISFGAMFAVFLLVQALRRRRKRKPDEEETQGHRDEGESVTEPGAQATD